MDNGYEPSVIVMNYGKKRENDAREKNLARGDLPFGRAEAILFRCKSFTTSQLTAGNVSYTFFQ
jgi:hypothetical protein